MQVERAAGGARKRRKDGARRRRGDRDSAQRDAHPELSNAIPFVHSPLSLCPSPLRALPHTVRCYTCFAPLALQPLLALLRQCTFHLCVSSMSQRQWVSGKSAYATHLSATFPTHHQHHPAPLEIRCLEPIEKSQARVDVSRARTTSQQASPNPPPRAVRMAKDAQVAAIPTATATSTAVVTRSKATEEVLIAGGGADDDSAPTEHQRASSSAVAPTPKQTVVTQW